MVGGVNLNEHPLVPQKPVTAAFSKESLDVFLNSSRKSRFATWDGEMHDAKLKQFTQQEWATMPAMEDVISWWI